ncbi:hypothetical protein APHAL10511_006146 [Amanita phalloides]|nr:hypothetical protein APHAL10511_006146 [Amanita phalloides]
MEKANNSSAEQYWFATMVSMTFIQVALLRPVNQWNRLTFSRLTIIYSCFTFLHFTAQITLQSKALSINIHTLNILTGIVTNQTVLNQGLPIMQGSTLKVCAWVPWNIQTDVSACRVIWDATHPTTNVSSSSDDIESVYVSQPTIFTTLPTPFVIPSTTAQTFSAMSSVMAQPIGSVLSATTVQLSSVTPNPTTIQTSSVTPITTTIQTSSTTTTVQTSSVTPSTTTTHTSSGASLLVHPVSSFSLSPSPSPSADSSRAKGSAIDARQLQYTTDLRARVVVDELCQASLIWPISNLRNSEREDVVFMAFQCWVLGVSVVALLNESIPHMWASLVTHVMATGWVGFQISATTSFRSSFNQIIAHGTCKGMPDLSGYWGTRRKAEFAILILNIVALVISSYLTLRIIKLFGWQTFKRVGASLVISRIRRLVLLLSTAIQLSVFFIATTVSLWVDRLVNSSIGDVATFRMLYLVSSGITLALLLPWLATGWFGIHRELRLPTFFFLLLSLLYLGGWGVMFFSTTFLWTFVTWHFFSVTAFASVFLVCVTFILGVICRYNFGKGLRHHLNASPSESGRPTDVEKLQFPYCETLVPAFSQIGASPPLTKINASTNVGTVVIPALPSRSNSTAHSSQHNEDPSDARSNISAGLSHSSVLSSTRSGGCQEKRWVIE